MVLANAIDQNSTLETLALFHNHWDQPSAIRFHQIFSDRARVLPLRADFITSDQTTSIICGSVGAHARGRALRLKMPWPIIFGEVSTAWLGNSSVTCGDQFWRSTLVQDRSIRTLGRAECVGCRSAHRPSWPPNSAGVDRRSVSFPGKLTGGCRSPPRRRPGWVAASPSAAPRNLGTRDPPCSEPSESSPQVNRQTRQTVLDKDALAMRAWGSKVPITT